MWLREVSRTAPADAASNTACIQSTNTPYLPAGKASDAIAKLRADIMTQLNAYMATNALNSGEGVFPLIECSFIISSYLYPLIHIDAADPNLLEEAPSDDEALPEGSSKKKKGRKREARRQMSAAA